MIYIVFNANAKFGCRAWHICLGTFATTNLVLCDCGGQTSQELCIFMVVDLDGDLALFVVEFELLYKRELLSFIEEFAVLFGLLGFTSL